MKIESFKKLKDNRYKIKISNHDDITLYDDIIIKYNLLVNKELDEKKLTEILNNNKTIEAYYYAVKYLNKKMRTAKEIKDYLKKAGYSYNTVDIIIKKLYEDNYLNDQVYLDAYIHDQINLTINGPKVIQKNLIKLGFDESIIAKKINDIPSEIWNEKITKYIEKKKKVSNISAQKLKSKIILDLINKGFEKEHIFNILSLYTFSTDPIFIKKEYDKLKNKLEKKYSGNELAYYLKQKLLMKGFTLEEIEDIIEK